MNERADGLQFARCVLLVAAGVLMFVGKPALAAGEGSGLALRPAASQAPALGSISVGDNHACAVRADGTVACWGDNYYGQSTPPIGTFTQVAAGRWHSCGLRTDGTLTCWGTNYSGVLNAPSGTFTQISVNDDSCIALRTDGTFAWWGSFRWPPPSSDEKFLQVAESYRDTCGLKTDGTLACWDYLANLSSPPTSGIFTQISVNYDSCIALRTDGTVAGWKLRTNGMYTSPPGTFIQVTGGGNDACGLKTDGTISCWNYSGQSITLPGTFTQVADGPLHTCGLRTDGTLTCWGDNLYGQSTPPSGTFGRSSVSAGGYHACEVRTDGTLSCWGDNGEGQSTPPSGTFTQVTGGDFHTCGLRTDGTVACWGWNGYLQSTPPPGTFTQITAGSYHTCGIRTDGTVACWGLSDFDQSAPPAGTFTQVAAGGWHTCGLRTDGRLGCWGHDAYGQGNGAPSDTLTQIAAGDTHTCGLRTDGTVVCWGYNGDGRSTPPAGIFTQVTAGSAHSCGLRTDGTVACWGYNSDGQSTPPSGTFTQVTAGVWHTCGRRTNGTTVCWGYNAYGQVAQVGFSRASSSGGESTSPALLEVVLTPASTKSVTVKYATANGTAKAGSDFTARTGTLTFAPGQTSKTIGVPILNDAAGEPDESFTVTLSAPVNASLDTMPAQEYMILNDDGSGAIRLSAAAYSVSEAGPAVTVTAQRVGGSIGMVRVGYATSDGTGTAGSDYTTTSGELSWADGDTADKSFTVPVANDALDEPNETFAVSLSSPSGAVMGAPAKAIVTIVDNDPTPTVHFSAAASVVTEPITNPNWDGGTFHGVHVVLSVASAKPVTVMLAAENGSAVVYEDYSMSPGHQSHWTTLTFSPGETSKTFRVYIHGDYRREDDESFTLTLSHAVNAVVGAPSKHVVRIVDDDPLPTVQFSQPASEGSESTTPAAIEVTLSASSGKTITVQYATVNGGDISGARSGSDYTARSGTLTFAPGQTSKSISVPIVNNTSVEPNESFMVTLLAPVNATLGATTTHTYTILDEDLNGAIRLSAAKYTVGEAGPVATITAQRVGGSAGAVEVMYATWDGTATDGNDYISRYWNLSWEAGDKANKTFTVPITNDVIDEPNETFLVELSSPNGVAVLGSPVRATVTIFDNDATPAVRFSSATSSGPESATPATLRIALSAPSSRRVTVRYATANGTAVAVHDYAATTGQVRFNPGETEKTVAVRIFDDKVAEPNESFTVALSSPTNAVLGTPSRHVFTIVNNDAAADVAAEADGAADAAQTQPGTAVGTEAPPKRTIANDFDGDGRSDLGVYDATTGEWDLRLSAGGETTVQLGTAGSVPVTGDFDEDGISDIGVYQLATTDAEGQAATAGIWYSALSAGGVREEVFGGEGSMPVAGDFDGDGRDDVGVFDPATGTWRLHQSAEGDATVRFGSAGSAPVTGDFDGDGRCDLGVFDAAAGLWSLRLSGGGELSVQLGSAGSVPITGDFDGDDMTDCGTYTPADGTWEIALSSAGRRKDKLGGAGAIPFVGDYDGDGTDDIGCYVPAVSGTEADSTAPGIWQILQSRDGYREERLGDAEAIPIGSRF